MSRCDARLTALMLLVGMERGARRVSLSSGTANKDFLGAFGESRGGVVDQRGWRIPR